MVQPWSRPCCGHNIITEMHTAVVGAITEAGLPAANLLDTVRLIAVIPAYF